MRRIKDHESIPFAHPIGEGIGRGQDNVVAELGKRAAETGLVIKWNHDYKGRVQPETEEVLSRVAYKKNKYEILRAFLGDFIPESYFALGTKTDNGKLKKKEFTIQQQVPDFRLRALTEEQLQSPKLRANIGLLLSKLESMYLAMGMVNARTGSDVANLDGKLDLGGISEYARQFIEYGHSDDDVRRVIASEKILDSPNICVDPESLDIYCVDFGKGEWDPSKDAAKDMLFEMLERRPDIHNAAIMTADQYQQVHGLNAA